MNNPPHSKKPRLTFTTEEIQDYNHKQVFLYFLHELEPDVEKTLIKSI